jgi:hypothetical protein
MKRGTYEFERIAELNLRLAKLENIGPGFSRHSAERAKDRT